MSCIEIILLVVALLLGIGCYYYRNKAKLAVGRRAALLSALQGPAFVVDAEGVVLRRLNCGRHGVFASDEQMLKPGFNIASRFVNAADVEKRKQMLKDCIASGKRGSMTAEVINAAGEKREMVLNMSANYGGTVIEISTDITDRLADMKKHEIVLQGVSKQLRLALKSLGAMVWSYGDAEADKLLGNDRSGLPEEYLAPEEEQLHLQDDGFKNILPEYRDAVVAEMTKVRNGEKDVVTLEFQGYITKSQKEPLWFRTTATALERDANRQAKCLVGATVVIEDQKRKEAEIIKAKEKAEESDRMKSIFLSDMSHEVRTPLNAILGFSKLISTSEDPEEIKEFEKIIESNGDLLINIINDVLDLSRLEAGQYKIEKERLEINGVCELAVASMKPKCHEGLTLGFERTMPDVELMADRKRVMQVVMQIVGNAIKYTNDGTIEVRCEKEGDCFVKISIKDTGEGMSEESKKNAFKRFFRASTTAQGTGLGLPICKKLVNLWGGQIVIESKKDVGSNIWFTIPIE